MRCAYGNKHSEESGKMLLIAVDSGVSDRR